MSSDEEQTCLTYILPGSPLIRLSPRIRDLNLASTKFDSYSRGSRLSQFIALCWSFFYTVLFPNVSLLIALLCFDSIWFDLAWFRFQTRVAKMRDPLLKDYKFLDTSSPCSSSSPSSDIQARSTISTSESGQELWPVGVKLGIVRLGHSAGKVTLRWIWMLDRLFIQNCNW